MLQIPHLQPPLPRQPRPLPALWPSPSSLFHFSSSTLDGSSALPWLSSPSSFCGPFVYLLAMISSRNGSHHLYYHSSQVSLYLNHWRWILIKIFYVCNHNVSLTFLSIFSFSHFLMFGNFVNDNIFNNFVLFLGLNICYVLLPVLSCGHWW